MAHLIYQNDSTAQHLRLGRRHIRLCGRVAGATKFVAPLQQKLNILGEKHQIRQDAGSAREDAYDDLILCDVQLDNSIRTLFERTKQYDRDNGGRVLDVIFPNHTFSEIVRMPLSKEPQEVNKLLIRLESLDPAHEVRAQVEPLRQRNESSKAAWNNYRQAIDRERETEVAGQLAKMEVRQQYEHNYLDARKEFGSTVADSIFPKIHRKPNGEVNESPAEEVTTDNG
jgi:hypothetical protein